MIDSANSDIDVDVLMDQVRKEIMMRGAVKYDAASYPDRLPVAPPYKINEFRFSSANNLLDTAQEAASVRTTWPVRAEKLRLPRPLRRFALKVLAYLFSDQRTVNNIFIASSREMLALQLEGVETVRDLVHYSGELSARVTADEDVAAAVKAQVANLQEEIDVLRSETSQLKGAVSAIEDLRLGDIQPHIESDRLVAELQAQRVQALETAVDALHIRENDYASKPLLTLIESKLADRALHQATADIQLLQLRESLSELQEAVRLGDFVGLSESIEELRDVVRLVPAHQSSIDEFSRIAIETRDAAQAYIQSIASLNERADGLAAAFGKVPDELRQLQTEQAAAWTEAQTRTVDVEQRLSGLQREFGELRSEIKLDEIAVTSETVNLQAQRVGALETMVAALSARERDYASTEFVKAIESALIDLLDMAMQDTLKAGELSALRQSLQDLENMCVRRGELSELADAIQALAGVAALVPSHEEAIVELTRSTDEVRREAARLSEEIASSRDRQEDLAVEIDERSLGSDHQLSAVLTELETLKGTTSRMVAAVSSLEDMRLADIEPHIAATREVVRAQAGRIQTLEGEVDALRANEGKLEASVHKQLTVALTGEAAGRAIHAAIEELAAEFAALEAMLSSDVVQLRARVEYVAADAERVNELLVYVRQLPSEIEALREHSAVSTKALASTADLRRAVEALAAELATTAGTLTELRQLAESPSAVSDQLEALGARVDEIYSSAVLRNDMTKLLPAIGAIREIAEILPDQSETIERLSTSLNALLQRVDGMASTSALREELQAAVVELRAHTDSLDAAPAHDLELLRRQLDEVTSSLEAASATLLDLRARAEVPAVTSEELFAVLQRVDELASSTVLRGELQTAVVDLRAHINSPDTALAKDVALLRGRLDELTATLEAANITLLDVRQRAQVPAVSPDELSAVLQRVEEVALTTAQRDELQTAILDLRTHFDSLDHAPAQDVELLRKRLDEVTMNLVAANTTLLDIRQRVEMPTVAPEELSAVMQRVEHVASTTALRDELQIAVLDLRAHIDSLDHAPAQDVALLRQRVDDFSSEALRRHDLEEAAGAIASRIDSIEAATSEHTKRLPNVLAETVRDTLSVVSELERRLSARLQALETSTLTKLDLEANEISLQALREGITHLAVHGRLLPQLRKGIEELQSDLASVRTRLALLPFDPDNTEIAGVRSVIDELRAELKQLEQRMELSDAASEHRLNTIDFRSATLDQRMTAFEPRFFAHEERLETLLVKSDHLDSAVAQQLSHIVPRLEHQESAVARLTETVTASLDNATVDDEVLLRVADEFRGSEESITERLAIYLPRLEPLRLTKNSTTIDLGTGRGEWLRLLQRRGLSPIGIDTNTTLVRRLCAEGLSAVQSDALKYLRTLHERSVSLVTAFHLIEHVGFGYAERLINEIARVVRPGGMIIIETPNPANVLTASCNFYLDPTHRHPVPSQLLRLQCELNGFVDIEVVELNANEHARVPGESALVDRFNSLFYGAMDYAIVARSA